MVQSGNKYRLVLLGKPEIIANETPVKISRAKGKGIIFYLATQDKDVSRDRLQDMFWPELDQQTAQHNLNVNLSSIRKQLPGLIETDSDYVRISSGVNVDCRQFDDYFDADRFEAEKHRAILSLYRGDFLEGLNFSGSNEFDTWRSMMREHYLNVFIKGLLRMADYHHKRGEYQDELAVLQNALQLDPLQESVYRSVMQIHYQNGDFLQANATYQKLKRVLDEEIGTTPMQETQQLYNAMLEHRPAESPVHSKRQHFTLESSTSFHVKDGAGQRFVGMQNLLAALRENAAQHKISILKGIEGSGKTSVLREFSGSWSGLVLWVNCRYATEDLPYRPIAEALEEVLSSPDGIKYKGLLSGKLGAKRCQIVESFLLDGAVELDPHKDGIRKKLLFDALVQLITVLGSLTPLLVIADDLEFADEGTLQLMDYIAISCRGSLSFVTAVSPLYFRRNRLVLSARFRELDFLERFSMPGFSEEDVKSLLPAEKREQKELAEWLWKMAGKNPYQLWELLRTVTDDVDSSEDPFDQEFFVIPARIREYYETLVLGLTETAKSVLEIAAVYGTEVPYKVILQTEVFSTQVCLSGLDELLNKGMLCTGENEEYSFFTAIIRETAYALITPSRRQWIHQKLAEAIERDESLVDQDARLGLLAHHFSKSLYPKRAVPYAVQAGDDAYKKSAWLDAIDYYEMARKYSDDSEFLLRYLTAAYLSAGEVVKYKRLSEEYKEQSKRRGERIKYLVNEINDRFAEKEPIEEYRWAVVPAYFIPCNQEEEILLEEAKQLLEEPITDRYFYCRLCITVAIRYCAFGDFERALSCIEKVIQNYTEFSSEEQSLVLMAHLSVGAYLGFGGETERAMEILETGISKATDRGVIFAEAILRCEYGRQLAIFGNVSEAEKQLQTALSLSKEYRMAYVQARTLFEIGRIKQNDEGKNALREALDLTEHTSNCRHLQIHILNELYPFFSKEESARWSRKIEEMNCLSEN